MIYLKIFLRDDKVKRWIEQEHVKVSSILMILKKNLGFKNQDEIIKKTGLDPCFLRIKLCWREDTEYSEITQILNGIISYYSGFERGPYFYRGRVLLNYVVKNEVLAYIPYFRTEVDGTKSLMFWTIEKTIERWIKEKF